MEISPSLRSALEHINDYIIVEMPYPSQKK